MVVLNDGIFYALQSRISCKTYLESLKHAISAGKRFATLSKDFLSGLRPQLLRNGSIAFNEPVL